MLNRRKKEESHVKSSMRDKVRKRAEERENQGGGGFRYNLPENTQFFTPKKGVMSIDILPYRVSDPHHPSAKPGEVWYQRTVFCHYGVGPEEKTYLCLKTAHKKCPICEQRAQLIKEGSADEELLKALKPKERELYNVVDLSQEDKGVQLWDISYYLFGKQLEEEVRNGKEEWAGFAELQGGYTLKVRFAEKVFGGNKFLETSRIDFEDRDTYPDSVLDEVIDLDKILNILTYEQLEKVFLEIEDSGASSEKEEETEQEIEKEEPVRKSLRGSSAVPGKKSEIQKETEQLTIPEDKEESKKTESPKRTKPTPPSSKSVMKCPHGGEFGKDVNELDDCGICDIWEKCDERATELGK